MEGDRAWLFDNEDDHLDLETRIAGFDMTHLLEDPVVRTPTMMYLFHRVEERLNGQPSIIVVDEGWKALDDDVFVARIRDWEKPSGSVTALSASRHNRPAMPSKAASPAP